jgi:hypothetical protein
MLEALSRRGGRAKCAGWISEVGRVDRSGGLAGRHK